MSFKFDSNKFVYKQCDHIDKLYDSLGKDDPIVSVYAAIDVLNKYKGAPKLQKSFKCEDRSFSHRQEGNEFFKDGDYTGALKMYNLAIASAPKRTQSLLLAYSNRSALLQRIKAYSAALQDVETCLPMKSPPSIEKKLKLRKEECLRMAHDESSHKKSLNCCFGKNYFNLPTDIHPDIPCVSTSVDVVIEGEKRKVVAAKDISVGSVVVLETPFASHIDFKGYYLACHHCQKFEFNLIPCDTCSETLFCSNECKEICNQEYHNIECQLMDLIKRILPEFCYRIALKICLKLKSMTSWEELIAAASNCYDKKVNKSLSDIYDGNNINSILNMTLNINLLVFGEKYNHCFMVATLIEHLKLISGFFPSSEDLNQKAIDAFSKIMMHLIPLYKQTTVLHNVAISYPKMVLARVPYIFSGLFSFTSKLKHDCEPNLLVVGMNHKAALVAIKPIKQGTELTISYIGHWFDRNYENLRPAKLVFVKPDCQCRVCVRQWSTSNLVDGYHILNEKQKGFLVDWFMQTKFADTSPEATRRLWNKTLRGLDMLHNHPQTKQYFAVYQELRKMLSHWQYLASENAIIVL